VDDFNEFHSENEDNDIIKIPDFRKKSRSDRPGGNKRWLIPLVLLLLIIDRPLPLVNGPVRLG